MNENVSPKTETVDLRGEPFRLFFPMALLLGIAGVFHWVLYGSGVLQAYLASFHAVTQMQSFLLAFATGFLLTAIPKRTRSAKASILEIALLMVLLPTISMAEFLGVNDVSQIAYMVVIVTLIQFAVKRFLGAAALRRPPASFVLVPIGLLSGAIGALLRVLSNHNVIPAKLGSLGRLFALEGLFTCLVLGIGGFFFSLALRGEAPPDLGKSKGDGRRAALFGLAGVGIVTGLILQDFGAVREGLALRALIAILVLVSVKGQLPPAKPGMNRYLVWLSAWCVPIGLILAAVFPDDRIAWMHVVYIGGFGLLGFSVAAHVTLGHGGYDKLRDGFSWQGLSFGLLFTGAMVLRATLTFVPEIYFAWLAAAAGMWLVGAMIWAVFLIPKMWRLPIHPENAGA